MQLNRPQIKIIFPNGPIFWVWRVWQCCQSFNRLLIAQLSSQLCLKWWRRSLGKKKGVLSFCSFLGHCIANLTVIDCIQEPIDSIAISNFSDIIQCPQQILNIVQIVIQLTLIKLTCSCTEKHSHGNAIQIPFPLSRSEAMPFSLSAKERRSLHRVKETMSHPDVIIQNKLTLIESRSPF